MLGLGEPLHLKIERAGKTVELDATPQIVEQVDIFGDKHRIGQLGIQSTPSGGDDRALRPRHGGVDGRGRDLSSAPSAC